MRDPDPDAPDRTRTGLPPPVTRTFDPSADPPSGDTRPSPPASHSTPFGPPGFDLLGKIGEGGMGTVLKAYDTAVGRVVALKVLKLNVFDERVARERFAREVRVMADIEHPNLVPVYHSGEHNGVPYFTMRYMPGGTLSGLRAGGRLGPRRAAELLRAIAGGVAALHARGIVHRDLKPANVLLDADGTPHVADFGLVKWLDDDTHTQTGVRNGTPQYMSPEQVAGRSRKLTPACDVWALGVIGYELACGKRPFSHDDREDLFRAISNDRPPDPYSLAPDLPPPLAQVILTCLNKDPLARYPTAAELLADLDRFLAGRPVEAVPPTVTAAQAPVRRRTFLKVAAGVLGVGAAGGLGAVAYLFTRKPDPPEPTFAEATAAALARGEAVELIGESGPPAWRSMAPADSLSVLAAADGTFTVAPNPASAQPFTLGWLDLFAEPIPVPFRFEAEVCYRARGAGEAVFAGVYVGRRLWDAQGTVWQTAALLLHVPPAPPQQDDSAALVMAADPVKERMTVGQHPLTAEVPPLPGGPALNRWVKLAVELRGGELAAECDGVRLTPRPAMNGAALRAAFPDMVSRRVKYTPRLPNDPPPPIPTFAAEPSLFGPAVGVFVWNATASVRLARLVPLPGESP